MRILPVLALALSAAACGKSTAPKAPPGNGGNTLEVTVAAVTLADDCGTGPTAAPVDDEAAAAGSPGQINLTDQVGPRAQKVAPGFASQSSMGDRACEQSSIQLRVANGTGAASAIAIEKIEIVDSDGTVLGEATPREPSLWKGDSYQAWDQQAAAGQTLQVSYALSPPPLLRGATYTVRVTVATGADQRTLEKSATLESEGMLPPGAVT